MEASVDIADVVELQHKYFATGETIDVSFRIACLERLKDEIRANEVKIAEALKEDLGKSAFESYMCETGLTLSELSYQIEHVRRWARPQRVPTDLTNFKASSFTLAEPKGVVLVMSPWNYPFMLTMEPMIGAVAAGNCCILKPSAYSPATSRLIVSIIANVFEPEHVTVIEGGREENSALLEQRFDHIFFTGSAAVGRLVLQKAAPWLTPVSLELGGKSPAIVTDDADINRAASRIVWGKFLNCGQTCVAPDYVLVDEKVHDHLVTAIKREIIKQLGSDPLSNPDYGHIINRKHFDRILGLIDEDKLVFGGQTNPDSLQIAPVVMDAVTAEDAIMGQEVFGPILPILSYRSLEEAESFIKEREKPLALYLFSSQKRTQKRFLQHVPFGGGCLNDTVVHMATSYMPFGGIGHSGMAQYHGFESFRTFSHIKSIMKKNTWVDVPLRKQPYRDFSLKIIRMLLR